MVDTAGKKLKQARLRKQLSLEEVARTTKIRVPRLAELENDDYSNFPSMAYVRGFLYIYAKYLGVDVSDYTSSLGSSATSVGIGDYEYLSNAPERVDTVVHRKPKRSVWPLVVLGILLVFGLIAAVVANFVIDAQRLGNLDALAQRHMAEQQGASGSSLQDKPARSVNPVAAADRSAEPSLALRNTEPGLAPTPAPTLSAAPAPEIRRAQPAVPEAQPTPASLPSSDLGPKDVVVKAVKKTWVKITKDSPDSPALYEDWLYPDTLPLRLRGAKFFIQVSDPSALQITKNGAPQPIDQPSNTIQ